MKRHLYIAFISVSDSGGCTDATPEIVGTGTTWTQIDAGEATQMEYGMAAYRFRPLADVNDVALSTGTLVPTCGTGTHEGIVYQILDIASGFDGAGNNGAGAIANYEAGRTSAVKAFTLNMNPGPNNGSLVIASFGHTANEVADPDDLGNSTTCPPANDTAWTELAGSDKGHASPNRSSHVIYDDTMPGTGPGSCWATSAKVRGIAIEIMQAQRKFVGAGDIAQTDADPDAALTGLRVQDVLAEASFNTAFTVGDNAYDDGTIAQYNARYAPTWGSFKDDTEPTPGNHEYHSQPVPFLCTGDQADGFREYFGTLRFPCGQELYRSFNLGSNWHVVALDTEILDQDPLAADAQETWFQNDLIADTHTCDIAYGHHPPWSDFYTQGHKDTPKAAQVWDIAVAQNVDIFITGHSHMYQRFPRMDANGAIDANGTREFIVGTGGGNLDLLPLVLSSAAAEPEAVYFDYGVLSISLLSSSYKWEFRDKDGIVRDSDGPVACH